MDIGHYISSPEAYDVEAGIEASFRHADEVVAWICIDS